ncbi:MAG: hypothetical protein A2945_00065 [Candidatus Liptonbacteria bacterium RIFCSPLOWO2_01_FULL_52_25]|uniref:Uncharacterized protein n=1 Tax=Candidatus Liptonbacteria bacterium RIFCSPLOWO2_01_FULL_52_25 TaxID=1798650 RepID=A0A1G2CCG9_9BACT|nr:MAG: hypothetical protein A2945_00065 [Candidatus Liptonbacteria bacterium RIFCSPLOWO2_01_FULL_52_25]
MRKYHYSVIILLTFFLSVFFNLPRTEAQTTPTPSVLSRLSTAQLEQFISQLSALIAQLKQQLAILQGQTSRPIVSSPSPISSTLPPPPITAFPSKYNLLLNNQKINSAITKSGALQVGEIEFLQDKILELENNNTQTWNQFLHPQPFGEQEMRKMWLQQVALSLYVEANKIVPWSILSYENESLNLLLAYPIESYSPGNGIVSFSVFNHNPIIPYNYAKEISKLYSNAPNTPKNFLYSLVMRMRNDGWIHAFGDPYSPACGISNGYPVTFSCVGETKRGTSTVTPLFIKSVLAAYNIPSQFIHPYFGHGGIFFPTLSLAMDGDALYDSFLGGLLIRPNKIPVENSFINLNLVKTWLTMPTCQGPRLNARANVLAYLALYNKPEWREDLIAAYNYKPDGSYYSGQWLKEWAIKGTMPFFCQNTDPAASNYWTPILSESEWSFWLGKIASVSSS